MAIVIGKAEATVTVTGYTGVYDAAAHGASGTATGVGGVDLRLLAAGSTWAPASPTCRAGRPTGRSAAARTTWTRPVTWPSSSARLTRPSRSPATRASTTRRRTGPAGTATGVGERGPRPGLDLGMTFTDVPGGTATWTFKGGTNYKDESGDVAIVISKADARSRSPATRASTTRRCTGRAGTATGVGGVDLSDG